MSGAFAPSNTVDPFLSIPAIAGLGTSTSPPLHQTVGTSMGRSFALGNIELFSPIRMPSTYRGGNIVVAILSVADTSINTGHAYVWDVAFDRWAPGTTISTDSFATGKTVSVAPQGTLGQLPSSLPTITFSSTEIDGILAGDWFRLQITRLSSGNTAAGNVTLLGLSVGQ